MKKSEVFVVASWIVAFACLVLLRSQYLEKHAALERANVRITELTQTIRLKDSSVSILDTEVRYQRRRVEICESREHLRETRDAERRARREPNQLVPSRWYNP